MKRVRIGGQAVMEGVMMKNGDRYAVAVRKPDKDIEVKVVDYVSMASRSVFFRVPIIRGVVNFVESLVIGVKTLTYSASFYDDEEPEKAEKEKKEKKKERTTEQQKRADDAAMIGTVLFSLVFAIALFMMLPAFIGELIDKVIDNRIIMSAIEGVIRLGIFLGYVALISLMKDIQRVFMYHGAEHKTINCFEAGVPLTPENVKKYSRYHKRCGTSFLFLVMIVSIFLHFIFVLVPSYWFRLFGRLLMVPVVSGISFEIIQWAGRTDSKFALMMSKPGMAMQKFTTKEPTADMAEVAIKAVEAVFDWRAYLKTEFNLDIPYENKENGNLSAASAQSESGDSEERTGNVPETGAAQ